MNQFQSRCPSCFSPIQSNTLIPCTVCKTQQCINCTTFCVSCKKGLCKKGVHIRNCLYCYKSCCILESCISCTNALCLQCKESHMCVD